MAYGKTHAVTITTDASGDATDYSPSVNGRVIEIRYVKSDYAAGVDFAITTEVTGVGLWTQDNVNASATVAPSRLIQDQVGVDTTQRDFVWVVEERVKIVISNGGDTKSGTFHIVVG